MKPSINPGANPSVNPSTRPIVSVVIPTLNRPQLLLGAIQSALEQTFQALEVIVVVDGPDGATRTALATLADPRLVVVQHDVNRGGAASRLSGIAAAQGDWIAHLDDDDAWRPTKLERQLAVAQASPLAWPVVSCLAEVCFDQHREIWPRRLPRPGEPISEYLFVRHGLFQGEGLLQSSTLLVPRALYDRVPLNGEGRNHDDWDWTLRAAAQAEVGFEFVAEPLTLWNLRTSHSHMSSPSSNRWHSSRDWIQEHRDRVTPRAYASFLLAEVAARAAAARDWSAFLPLLQEAIALGRPSPKMLLLYLGMWLLPPQQRQQLRASLGQLRGVLSPRKSPSALEQS